MLILGMDTASKIASAAVLDAENQKILAEIKSQGRLSHSENLMPMIDSTLKCAGISPDEIGLFAAASGPGSFTGIRIAVATAKGLAFGSNADNCVGVSSLLALAYNFYGYGGGGLLVLPVIDARRKQVYNAVFENLGYIKSDRIITLSELEAELNAEFSGRKVVFSGDGAGMCEEIDFAGIIRAPDILKQPSAVSLCRAAYDRYKKEGAQHARAMAPAYLIKTQAEREYEKNGKK
ncbi:MAG: tRNA (adenosine(37)-N6)-threonylcarbamoyltransferase complex dimerization subunit type 1 TsaB [Oscillospiraceae bacterium]|nr:tRNA (adenosine(37)-N6)-threonylcarbamoyltransferase complex dimerization subunit type 1 TsaB [Oscillospiraceae bacterium]